MIISLVSDHIHDGGSAMGWRAVVLTSVALSVVTLTACAGGGSGGAPMSVSQPPSAQPPLALAPPPPPNYPGVALEPSPSGAGPGAPTQPAPAATAFGCWDSWRRQRRTGVGPEWRRRVCNRREGRDPDPGGRWREASHLHLACRSQSQRNLGAGLRLVLQADHSLRFGSAELGVSCRRLAFRPIRSRRFRSVTPDSLRFTTFGWWGGGFAVGFRLPARASR